MKNFSFNRYLNLLRYDWQENKRSWGMTYTIITLVYIVLTVLIFSFCEVYDIRYNVKGLNIFTTIFFAASNIFMVLYVTTILQKKFTKVQSSTSYMTLPASHTEKWAAMVTDYLFGDLGIGILFVVCFYLTDFAGYCIDSSYSWFSSNPYSPLTNAITELDYSAATAEAYGQIAKKEFYLTLQVFVKMSICIAWVQQLYYIILNTFFKHNGQIKSALLFLLTGLILNILQIGIMAWIGDHLGVTSIQNENSLILFDILRGILYLAPFVILGELAYLHHRIVVKQAK